MIASNLLKIPFVQSLKSKPIGSFQKVFGNVHRTAKPSFSVFGSNKTLFSTTNDHLSQNRFYRRMKIDSEISDSQKKLLSITENSARRHGFDNLLSYLSGIPEEVLRRQLALKQDILKSGFNSSQFFDHLHYLQYLKRLSEFEPQNVDQINDIIIAGNTISLRVEELFNGSVVATDGKGTRLNGIFGKQGMLKKQEELKDVDDLMPFLYILNSTIRRGNPLPAYFLFFGETPNPVKGIKEGQFNLSNAIELGESVLLEYNSGSWFNANLAIARYEKFVDEAVAMSLDVTPPGIIVVDNQGKPAIVPLLSAIYDTDNMTLWKVERKSQGIFATRMEDWLKQNINTMVYPDIPLFSRKDIIEKHIERLTSHATHGSEHMQMRSSIIKKVGCVDGRQDNNKSDIGSLIGLSQLMNLAVDNTTRHIRIAFHTECGYILTAIVLHLIFKAMKESINPHDEITMARAQLFIKTLMDKPWVRRDAALYSELLRHLDLNRTFPDPESRKKIEDLLQSLVTDNHGTLRYATSHMSDRGLFENVDGFPSMTAYRNVEAALKKHDLTMDDTTVQVLVIEELARLDMISKKDFLTANKDIIARKRLDKSIPTFEWMVEDFCSGRYYQVPSKLILDQSKEEILDTTRIDSKTSSKIDPFKTKEAILKAQST